MEGGPPFSLDGELQPAARALATEPAAELQKGGDLQAERREGQQADGEGCEGEGGWWRRWQEGGGYAAIRRCRRCSEGGVVMAGEGS